MNSIYFIFFGFMAECDVPARHCGTVTVFWLRNLRAKMFSMFLFDLNLSQKKKKTVYMSSVGLTISTTRFGMEWNSDALTRFPARNCIKFVSWIRHMNIVRFRRWPFVVISGRKCFHALDHTFYVYLRELRTSQRTNERQWNYFVRSTHSKRLKEFTHHRPNGPHAPCPNHASYFRMLRHSSRHLLVRQASAARFPQFPL